MRKNFPLIWEYQHIVINMAIAITQNRKRQRYLLIFLCLTALAIAAVVWFGFLRKQKDISVEPAAGLVYNIPEVDINWQVLEEVRGETLQTFKKISAFEKEFGRKNPFIPY